MVETMLQIREAAGRIDRAIAEAESKTSGEIIAVVTRRSGHYLHGFYEAGIFGAGLALTILTVAFLLARGEWPHLNIGWYVATSAGGFLLGTGLWRIDALERMFARRDAMFEQCRLRAYQLFDQHGVFRTRARTGLLVFVSLFERVVVLLGDDAITAKVPAGEFERIVSLMVETMKRGNLEQALTRGIEAAGAALAQHLPRGADDVNELPDRLYVL